jgi:hypothetical protein
MLAANLFHTNIHLLWIYLQCPLNQHSHLLYIANVCSNLPYFDVPAFEVGVCREESVGLKAGNLDGRRQGEKVQEQEANDKT